MAEHKIDLDTWPRAKHFRLFRDFERPHFAITCRLDVTRLMIERKPQGVSPYRACLFAIGAGLHAVPELRMRLRADGVVQFDHIAMSMTVPRSDGTFGFGYVDYQPVFSGFDRHAQERIAAARDDTSFNPNTFTEAVAYMSCLPWLDFTSLDNALPHAKDSIPRIGWGKICAKGDQQDMAMSIQVHHALVDGVHVGEYFAAVQKALDTL